MTRLDLTFASALLAATVLTASAATPESVVAENAPSSTAARETAAGSEDPSPGQAMTLDEITIEGAIDVPQVLFITARDHLRVTQPQHRVYWTDAVATVLELPAIGPVRPPVDDSATAASAPQREN